MELLADYRREHLMAFLMANSVPLNAAKEVCEAKRLIPELVFVLHFSGDKKRALMMIIHELQDINKALELVVEENEDELWEMLITESMKKPEFIQGLLNNVGTHIDPRRIIQRIPQGMEIPKLRDSLVKIMHDYNLQIELRKGCCDIITNDSIMLLVRLNRQQRMGVAVGSSAACSLCGVALAESVAAPEPLVVFRCQHAYHRRCLADTSMVERPTPGRRGEEDNLCCVLCRSEATSTRRNRRQPGRP
eukprot:m.64260 g.64260  ORF g.64260 m.64260 type:complete len:248 (+) comp13917_c0_seq1:2-745(+)